MMFFRKSTFYFFILYASWMTSYAGGKEEVSSLPSDGSEEVVKKKKKREKAAASSDWKRAATLATVVGGMAWAANSTLGKESRGVEEEVGEVPFKFVDKSWFDEEPRMDFTKGITSDVRAALIPHAGYRYSGQVSCQVVETVDWSKYDTIMILSTAHRSGVNAKLPKGMKALSVPYQEGRIEVEEIPEIAFREDKEALEREHSWQMALFVHQVNGYKKSLGQGPIKVAPFLIGEETSVDVFDKYLREHPRVFLLANTDLLHCSDDCPADNAKFDQTTIGHILDAIQHGTAIEGVREGKGTMCGIYAVRLFSKLAYRFDLEVSTSIRSDSFHLRSEQERIGGKYVGYWGVALAPRSKKDAYGSEIAKLDSDYFRAVPKQVLERHQDKLGQQLSDVDIARMAKPFHKRTDLTVHGIFVTLYKEGKLRGCIGTFDMNEQDLGEAIARQTLASALSDSRFEPITKKELPLLSYEITLLGPLFTVYKEGDILTPFKAFEQRYQEHHGVTITFEDGRKATYLSSVLKDMPQDRKERFRQAVAGLQKKSGATSDELKKIACYGCWDL